MGEPSPQLPSSVAAKQVLPIVGNVPPPLGNGGRRAFWLVWIGSWFLRCLVLTLRVQLDRPETLKDRLTSEPLIFVFWHNQLLLIPVIWNRFLNHGDRPQGMALTSLSSDGDLVAQFLRRFGIGSVRGSANRRGASSLRELAGWLKRGHDIGITPDGSRGPIYEIKPGLILLAQLSGRSILPLSFEFSSSWRLKSWDHFFIPKPFSKVKFVVGEPHLVLRTTCPADFETERVRCEQHLRAQIDEQ